VLVVLVLLLAFSLPDATITTRIDCKCTTTSRLLLPAASTRTFLPLRVHPWLRLLPGRHLQLQPVLLVHTHQQLHPATPPLFLLLLLLLVVAMRLPVVLLQAALPSVPRQSLGGCRR
jgi:hypothetical protein